MDNQLTQDIRPKAVTIDDYSSQFATFRDCSSLFALFSTIRYSLFATIRYSLFVFSKHPFLIDVVLGVVVVVA